MMNNYPYFSEHAKKFVKRNPLRKVRFSKILKEENHKNMKSRQKVMF
jgi:hypothetical protein